MLLGLSRYFEMDGDISEDIAALLELRYFICY